MTTSELIALVGVGIGLFSGIVATFVKMQVSVSTIETKYVALNERLTRHEVATAERLKELAQGIEALRNEATATRIAMERIATKIERM